eukprot:2533589-Rhodomonas_salina.1
MAKTPSQERLRPSFGCCVTAVLTGWCRRCFSQLYRRAVSVQQAARGEGRGEREEGRGKRREERGERGASAAGGLVRPSEVFEEV